MYFVVCIATIILYGGTSSTVCKCIKYVYNIYTCVLYVRIPNIAFKGVQLVVWNYMSRIVCDNVIQESEIELLTILQVGVLAKILLCMIGNVYLFTFIRAYIRHCLAISIFVGRNMFTIKSAACYFIIICHYDTRKPQLYKRTLCLSPML